MRHLALGLVVGHVHFMLFVSISFALGNHFEPSFRWNMGFRKIHCRCLLFLNDHLNMDMGGNAGK